MLSNQFINFTKGRISMKPFLQTLLLLMLISQTQYSQWTNQNIVPDGNDLWSTFFVDDSTGWIVGSDGFIKKTSNAGLDWVEQSVETNLTLKTVQFINPNTGWICGESGLITKTTNSGNHWISLASGTSENLTDLHFYDANTGYVVGFAGTILKTTNGGSSWISQFSGVNVDLSSVDFVDANVGYAVGGGYLQSNTSTIIKTTDGGLTWFELPLPFHHTSWSSLNTVEFIDANTGWIGVGYEDLLKGSIYKTTDGGNTWFQQYFGTEEKVTEKHKENNTFDTGYGIRSIFFKDSNNGYSVTGTIGWARAIITTTDAGNTWVEKNYDWESDGLLSVFVSNVEKGWAVGLSGSIFITEDNGDSWAQILSGNCSSWSGDNIKSIFCVNENTGWAVGERLGGSSGGPVILKTRDGGKIWKTQFFMGSSADVIRSVYFIDEYTGWVAGDQVLRTTNGGDTWVESNIGGNSLFFIDENTGWLVRETFNIYTDAIFKTTDGGVTWIPKATQTGFSVYFEDLNTGWVAGKNGSIRKSTDGGESWISKTTGTSNDLNSVRFYDSNLGLCVGNDGIILLSNDGGETWAPQTSFTTEDLKSVTFTNSASVWIVGSSGTILNSTDLGTSWTTYDEVTTNDLTALHFISENTGWIGGNGGTLFKYHDDVVPVELVSLTATLNNNTVELNWKTKTEVNNSGFEIQRQVGSRQSEAGNWKTIGFVPGFGTTTEPKSYFFADEDVTTGNYKYRLKQIDFDGTFKYSDEIEIIGNSTPREFVLYQNYPNPFNPTTKIRYQLPEESNVLIKVYDLLGTEIITLLNKRQETGVYEVELDANRLAGGIYIYDISTVDPSGSLGKTFSETKKMILLR